MLALRTDFSATSVFGRPTSFSLAFNNRSRLCRSTLSWSISTTSRIPVRARPSATTLPTLPSRLCPPATSPGGAVFPLPSSQRFFAVFACRRLPIQARSQNHQAAFSRTLTFLHRTSPCPVISLSRLLRSNVRRFLRSSRPAACRSLSRYPQCDPVPPEHLEYSYPATRRSDGCA